MCVCMMCVCMCVCVCVCVCMCIPNAISHPLLTNIRRSCTLIFVMQDQRSKQIQLLEYSMKGVIILVTHI